MITMKLFDGWDFISYGMLRQYHHRATFDMVGLMAEKYCMPYSKQAISDVERIITWWKMLSEVGFELIDNDKIKYPTHWRGKANRTLLPKDFELYFLNKNLYSTDKDILVDFLDWYQDNGTPMKWTSVKKVLKSKKYIIKDKFTQINNKNVRYSIIKRSD